MAFILIILSVFVVTYLKREPEEKKASAAYVPHPQSNVRVADPRFCDEQLRIINANGLIVRRTVSEFFVNEEKWASLPVPQQRLMATVARCSVVDGYLNRNRPGDIISIKALDGGKVLAVAFNQGVYIP
jgi:hypothetical protein